RVVVRDVERGSVDRERTLERVLAAERDRAGPRDRERDARPAADDPEDLEEAGAREREDRRRRGVDRGRQVGEAGRERGRDREAGGEAPPYAVAGNLVARVADRHRVEHESRDVVLVRLVKSSRGEDERDVRLHG